jgi:SAM-dependent methyltransferase
MNDLVFEYKGHLYPNYLKQGNGMQYIAAVAKKFCKGQGLDIGCGDWPLDGATGIDMRNGQNANSIPERVGGYDYIFSSHCLEHLENPIAAIQHWKSNIRAGGVLFLYLPHPDMEYWLPQNCKKHLHSWQPLVMAKILNDLGFIDVLSSERDMAWGFAVLGFNP